MMQKETPFSLFSVTQSLTQWSSEKREKEMALPLADARHVYQG